MPEELVVATPEELAATTTEAPLASLPSQSSHFLPNASGFQIVGGQFVLGNVNNHPPVAAQPPPVPVSPPVPAQTVVPSRTATVTATSSPAEILSESEIYCRRLLYQKRGFPLYVPDPQRNLPAEYRTSGVRIGHVGRVTPEGAFDPFFNIYYSAEHPINSRGVPDDFIPLPLYLRDDIFPLDYEPGDFVSSSSVQESDLDSSESVFPGSEFLFKCKGPDGALLALPHGSCLLKLENLESMRRYAAKNAESWYKYVNAPEGLGRRLVNGFLYLITGWEKSESWGMATFQNVAVEREFQLSFQPHPGADAGFNYRWRRGTPARTKRGVGPTHDGQNRMNQTLFIHGFSISLGEGIWGKLFPDVSISQIVDSQFQKSHSSFVPFSSQASSSFVFSLLGLGASYGGRTKADHHSDEVEISEFSPTPSVFHPSKVINDYLLREAPQATVAITHDDDWCRIFQEYDTKYSTPGPSQFLHRIFESFNFNQFPLAEEDGAIFFVAKPDLARELYETSLAIPRKIKVYMSAPAERKNGLRACDFCRGRKLKCDGAQPQCCNCESRGIGCIYSTPRSREKSRAEPGPSMKLETHSDEDLPLAPPTKAENDNEVFDALQALSLDSHTAGNIYPVKTSSEFYPDAMNLKKEDQDHSMLSITDHDIFGWKYSESVLSKPWLFPAVSKGYSHATAVRKKLPSAAEDFKEKRPIKSSRAPYTIERCVQCRRRKLKCDGVKPECETCRRTSNECSWVSIGGNIKKELTEDENAVSGPSGTSATGNKPEDGKVTNPEKISACVPCRQRNIKCDGVQPECGACQRRKSKECSWVSVGGRRKNEVADNEDAGSEPSLSGATRGSEPPTYSGDENLTSDNASSAASTSKKPLIHTVGSEAVTRASHLRRKAEGKYICDICGKTFTAKHNLRNHHNAHNGVKEFSCDVCHKHFSTMHTMKRHRKRCALITSNKLAT